LGMVKSKESTPKILGDWSLTKSLIIGEWVLCSASAKKAIESAWGSLNS
jgi:ribosomal protein L15